MISAFDDLPKKTIVIRWDRGHMRVHLHLVMPRMDKDDATKLFSILKKFLYWCPENEALVPEIRDWLYAATQVSYNAWKRANTTYQDGYQPTEGLPKSKRRATIAIHNAELLKDAKTARRLNDRLEDRLALFEHMFKGMLE